jgi:hypothetical protein
MSSEKYLVDVFDSRLFCQSIILPVDVLGQKVDVFVVDVLKVDVLEVVQMGRPEEGLIVFQTVFIKTVYLLNRR